MGLTEAHSLSDVQRFFMLLSPSSRKDAPHKLIPIGKKRLPDPASHERFFGFVQSVSQKVNTAACACMHAAYADASRVNGVPVHDSCMNVHRLA